MTSKADEYAQIVRKRKVCHACFALSNPADIDDGTSDSAHIGPWSLWQGNLNARLMVVGQDWGDTKTFIRQGGREGTHSPTNRTLVELIGVAGISIGAPGSEEGRNIAFFTNAILCLKSPEGGLQGQVESSWFKNCAPFLRRQIEVVNPTVVVGLGKRAHDSILDSFGLRGGTFRSEVESGGMLLPNGTRAFAVYHCGARIRNTVRPMEMQRKDWQRLRPFLEHNLR